MRKLVLAAMFGLLAAASARADEAADMAGLNAWCAKAALPASIAICSDPELRRLAIERQHAYDKLRATLDDAGKARLLANQNAWVKAYSSECGVPQGGAGPPLPLPSNIRYCMVGAAADRLKYFETQMGETSAAAATPIVPSVASPIKSVETAAAALPERRGYSVVVDPEAKPEDIDGPDVEIAKAALQNVEGSPEWGSVEITKATADDYSLNLWFKEGSFVLDDMDEIGAETITRGILKELVRRGRDPAKENIKVWVSAMRHTQGETGKAMVNWYGNASYNPYEDRVTYAACTGAGVVGWLTGC